MMNFKVIAHKVPGLLGKKNKVEDFSANSAKEARGMVERKFSKATEIILYQMLGLQEKPECFGEEYSRDWIWEPGIGWMRVIPGKMLPLSEAPDEATTKELTEKYLASLRS